MIKSKINGLTSVVVYFGKNDDAICSFLAKIKTEKKSMSRYIKTLIKKELFLSKLKENSEEVIKQK